MKNDIDDLDEMFTKMLKKIFKLDKNLDKNKMDKKIHEVTKIKNDIVYFIDRNFVYVLIILFFIAIFLMSI
jgi:hypothetical protein